MIVEVLLISIIVAFIRRGKISNITKYEVKWKLLPILYIIIQAFLIFGLNLMSESAKSLSMFIYLASYLILMAFLLRNLAKIESIVMLVGVFLNFAVTFINGGKMPISSAAAVTAKLNMSTFLARFGNISQAATSSTKLSILGDIIPMPGFYPLHTVFSIGDIFIFVGLFIAIQKMFVRPGEERARLPRQKTESLVDKFSIKKEVEREEKYFDYDVPLVDIQQFFTSDAEESFGDEIDDNAIARLVAEISEVKEPDDELYHSEIEIIEKKETKIRLKDMAKAVAEQPETEEEQELAVEELMIEVDEQEETILIEAPSEESLESAQEIQQVEAEAGKEEQEEQEAKVLVEPLVVQQVQTAGDDTAASEVSEPVQRITPESFTESVEDLLSDEADVAPGQLSFLEQDADAYTEMHKAASPLISYMEQYRAQEQQLDEAAARKAPPVEDIGEKLREEKALQRFKQASEQKIFEEIEQQERLEDTQIQKPVQGKPISDTMQMSLKDFVNAASEKDRIELGKFDMSEYDPHTRELPTRPSTKNILKALRSDPSAFEVNSDKFMITEKDEPDLSPKERKDEFLKKMREYDMDIRRTQAATTEEMARVETDIKREQGVNVDDMFIISDGRFVENPHYKHRKK